MRGVRFVVVLAVLTVAGSALPAQAQALRNLSANPAPAFATAICGTQPVPPARALPPEGSGPVVYLIGLCRTKQGAQTYLPDIQLKASRPSEGLWVPFDASAERVVLEDFERLWKNHSLQDLSIDVRDYQLSNGVIGKLVTYNIVEQN
jgi:hypothetical protein